MNVDFAQLVDGIGDGVVVSDTKGTIAYWNASAERIFGFSQQEALGASLDIIIPERFRERHWDGYFNTVKTGETRYGTELLRVPALNQEGQTISIAFTVALHYDENKEVNGVIAVVRDETERYREERRLKNRLATLEAASAEKGQAEE